MNGFHELGVAKSSTGYYVGIFKKMKLTQFVRLSDDFSSKQETVEWIEAKQHSI